MVKAALVRALLCSKEILFGNEGRMRESYVVGVAMLLGVGLFLCVESIG